MIMLILYSSIISIDKLCYYEIFEFEKKTISINLFISLTVLKGTPDWVI